MTPQLELRHSLTEPQIGELVALYQREWWSRGRDEWSVRLMLSSGGLVFALVVPGAERLAAFARVLTDQVYFAVILDVIVAPIFRGQGVGRRLVDSICNHPALEAVQSLELTCQPVHVPFYRKWGFTDEVDSSTLMRRTSAQRLKRSPGTAA
jgi:GNAT superfamily N-acetyltransferase